MEGGERNRIADAYVAKFVLEKLMEVVGSASRQVFYSRPLGLQPHAIPSRAIPFRAKGTTKGPPFYADI